MLDQALHQPEIAEAILLFTEQGVDHSAGGIVHREEQRELLAVLAQPAVMTAVQLDQHPLLWHPLTAHPVFRRASAPWTAQSSADQDAPKGGPAHVDALAFTEQLRHMSVIGSLVHRAGRCTTLLLVASGVALDGWQARWPWPGMQLLRPGNPRGYAWCVADSVPSIQLPDPVLYAPPAGCSKPGVSSVLSASKSHSPWSECDCDDLSGLSRLGSDP